MAETEKKTSAPAKKPGEITGRDLGIAAGIGTGIGLATYFAVKKIGSGGNGGTTPPPPECEEGAEKCQGTSLYKCQNGKWTLAEQDSVKCGGSGGVEWAEVGVLNLGEIAEEGGGSGGALVANLDNVLARVGSIYSNWEDIPISVDGPTDYNISVRATNNSQETLVFRITGKITRGGTTLETFGDTVSLPYSPGSSHTFKWNTRGHVNAFHAADDGDYVVEFKLYAWRNVEPQSTEVLVDTWKGIFLKVGSGGQTYPQYADIIDFSRIRIEDYVYRLNTKIKNIGSARKEIIVVIDTGDEILETDSYWLPAGETRWYGVNWPIPSSPKWLKIYAYHGEPSIGEWILDDKITHVVEV
jgi:hypothetical protein